MKIIIENKVLKKLIIINSSYENVEQIANLENLYLKILAQTLIGSTIKLLTIAPQKYSLAYGFNSSVIRKISGQKFLISCIKNCDLDLLREIVTSEEFNRTLLIIVKRASNLSDEELLGIIALLNNPSSKINEEVMFCEDDGDSLYLFNSGISLLELVSLAKKVTSEVTVAEVI